jgi:hypothetical protein
MTRHTAVDHPSNAGISCYFGSFYYTPLHARRDAPFGFHGRKVMKRLILSPAERHALTHPDHASSSCVENNPRRTA